MSILTIVAGNERHPFELGQPAWSPGTYAPDVRCIRKPVVGAGEMVLCENEVSNCSLTIGDRSKTRPRVEARIEIEPGPGWKVEEPRRYPRDWPLGRAAYRRFVLYKNDADRALALSIAEGRFCPDWRKRRERYGPCNLPLPRLGAQQYAKIVSIDHERYLLAKGELESHGEFRIDDWDDGVFFNWRGWAPHGPSDPDAVGGTGIYFATGWRQNRNDLRLAGLLAQCEHERDVRWYLRSTGEPISTEHYPGAVTPDTWGYPFLPPEANLGSAGGGDPLPPPYGFAHEIRGGRRSIQFAEQADSEMAKVTIAGRAAVERLRFTHRGNLPKPGYEGIGNLSALQWLAEKTSAPQRGLHTGLYGPIAGRQIGWPFFVNAADWKFNGPRGEMSTWTAAALKVVESILTPTGLLQKARGGSGGWPTDYFNTQAFEAVILAYGLAGLARQSGAPEPAYVRRVIGTLYGPNTKCPILSGGGPPHFVRSAEEDGSPVAEATTGSSYGDAAHALAGLALAASFETNPAERLKWIERGALYDHPRANWREKLDVLTGPGSTVLDWDASWIAMAQRAAAGAP